VSKAIVHTHAGDDSDGKIWGIEGLNILLILAGLILSVGLSMMLFRHRRHSVFVSFGVGSLPFVLMAAYVLGLRQGKPKSYDTDLLETFTSGTLGCQPTGSHAIPSTAMNAPNGWISHGLLIWNDLDKRGFVAKGFILEVPDLRHAGDRALNSFYEAVRQFLHTLEESTRAQFRWSVDSDYREELLSYKAPRRAMRAGFLDCDRPQRTVQPILASHAVRQAASGEARFVPFQAHLRKSSSHDKQDSNRGPLPANSRAIQ
jgi:hypothetical protein